ncbi:uncharacterized protein L203_102746 [Cryptococcus depauperatus CBS 7841]|uniref:Endoplasmic reticulum-Golgi intermediate compartment protein 2 n=1 Tax=Cryptococcus depauperatus CBS 7841 TaxID=1295531 RepID=A0AAJ8JSF2_9TREE
MYEPHLVNNGSENGMEGISLLEELDRIAPIKSFDAFPKVEPTYTIHSRRGGVLTAVVGLIIFLTTSANLTIDLRDAVGDRLHLSNSFVKDGTNFNIAGATSIKPTYEKVDDGPACRIYGSVQVKKVTANLHITTLGHGYMSFEHTDHNLMNLSHIMHEFSFGPFFPAITQPLDKTYEITEQPFTIFQYFLRVVPTTYIDASRRRLDTSQYAVTDYARSFEHGGGVPGLFFKYDLEPMSVEIRERTTTLYQFLIRLIGVIGGVWTVAAFSLRVFNRAQREVTRAVVGEKEFIPSTLPTPSPLKREASSYFGRQSPAGMMSRATSWVSANAEAGGVR